MNSRWGWVVVLSLASAHAAFADIVTIDFEGLADGTSVTNQYSGLLFSNATIHSAGVSLDSAEFPPHSGINAVLDDGGPISIFFSTEVLSFQAYFTYAEPLTATAFDGMGNEVDVANSLYSANYVSSGNPPNELISLSSAGGIGEVVLEGDPNGSSFFMDDVTYVTPALTAVPTPSSVALFATVLAFVCLLRKSGFAGSPTLFSRRW